jgi:hypothetical protein
MYSTPYWRYLKLKRDAVGDPDSPDQQGKKARRTTLL